MTFAALVNLRRAVFSDGSFKMPERGKDGCLNFRDFAVDEVVNADFKQAVDFFELPLFYQGDNPAAVGTGYPGRICAVQYAAAESNVFRQ